MQDVNYVNLLEALNYGLDNDESIGSVKYFRSDISSRYIWTCVLKAYYKKENICSEDLLRDSFLSHISRPTIFKIIDNAVAKKYFIKRTDEIDHRKANIIPTILVVDEFETWSVGFIKLYMKSLDFL